MLRTEENRTFESLFSSMLHCINEDKESRPILKQVKFSNSGTLWQTFFYFATLFMQRFYWCQCICPSLSWHLSWPGSFTMNSGIYLLREGAPEPMTLYRPMTTTTVEALIVTVITTKALDAFWNPYFFVKMKTRAGQRLNYKKMMHYTIWILTDE